jgi:hypothetical protein
MIAFTNGFAENRFPDLTVDSVLGNLPELLMWHVASARRTALIVDASDTRFVQAMVTESQQLIVECVSNRYLRSEDQLDLSDELDLMCIGFSPPESAAEPHPNWWWVRDNGIEVMKACGLFEFVLLNTFGLTRSDRVLLIERPLRVRREPLLDAA